MKNYEEFMKRHKAWTEMWDKILAPYMKNDENGKETEEDKVRRYATASFMNKEQTLAYKLKRGMISKFEYTKKMLYSLACESLRKEGTEKVVFEDVSKILDGITLPENYKLGCIKTGSGPNYNTSFRLFKDGEPIEEKILDTIQVEFTEDGVWQAFLLYAGKSFLPYGWHGEYYHKEFVFDDEMISDSDDTFFAKALRIHRGNPELQPSVTVHADRAYLRYTYWSEWEGLVQEVFVARKKGNTLLFEDDEYWQDSKFERPKLFLYKFNSGIRL